MRASVWCLHKLTPYMLLTTLQNPNQNPSPNPTPNPTPNQVLDRDIARLRDEGFLFIEFLGWCAKRAHSWQVRGRGS